MINKNTGADFKVHTVAKKGGKETEDILTKQTPSTFLSFLCGTDWSSTKQTKISLKVDDLETFKMKFLVTGVAFIRQRPLQF